jgi:hypothetical protein
MNDAKVETPASKKEAALAIAPPKFLAQMGEELACDPNELKATIFKTCMYDGATAEEFRTFLIAANRLELNPLIGEVYALKKKGGGIQVVVGKNGWNTIVNRNSAVYNGRELSYWFKIKDGSWKEFPHPIDGELVMVTCKIFRKDRDRPEIGHALYSEYYKDVKYDSPWQKYLTTMMEHKAYNKTAPAAFGMADAIDADEARDFCEIKSASSAAHEDFKSRGYYETPDGRLERDVTPEGPDLPQAGDTTSEPVPARPRKNGVKSASPKSYHYAKGMAIDKGGCPDDDTYKKFLEWKEIILPISHDDNSKLIRAFEAGDFSELHKFLGLGEDVPDEAPADDFLPGMSDGDPIEAPKIDEEKTKLFNDILDLKLSGDGAGEEIYKEAIDILEADKNPQDMTIEELEKLHVKMMEIAAGPKEKKSKKKSSKK